MKFSINDFFSKSDQIRGFLQIGSHLLKKFLNENLEKPRECSILRVIWTKKQAKTLRQTQPENNFVFVKNI